jgi:hypothetical protein
VEAIPVQFFAEKCLYQATASAVPTQPNMDLGFSR